MSVALLDEQSQCLSATASLGGSTEKISVALLYEENRRLMLSIGVPLKRQSFILSGETIDLLYKLKV
ncbi:hypothetical protein F2Q70_00016883 [Brassica cretica]|uniref:Uncharacterized protein n=1 Tax=Brassica cretica TaxID=69181 RepID=A0A3N6R479_BRACR|nr:hypothetical protein F2Q70_00016883 [Brassica cretica]